MNNRANHEAPLTRPDDHCELANAHVFTLAASYEYFPVVGDAHNEIQFREHRILDEEIRRVYLESDMAASAVDDAINFLVTISRC